MIYRGGRSRRRQRLAAQAAAIVDKHVPQDLKQPLTKTQAAVGAEAAAAKHEVRL
jgi:hypothetical protein